MLFLLRLSQLSGARKFFDTLVWLELTNFNRSLGGATATAPASGFDNGDLAVYFKQRAALASRTPTRAIPTPSNTTSPTSSPPSKKLSTGAIVGIAVGGAVVLIALLLGGCCLIRRRRKTRENAQPAYNPAPMHPHDPGSPYQHQHYQPTPHYQLPTNSPPVELSAGNLHMHQVDPKDGMRVNEGQYPLYNEWQESPIHPHSSPAMSPHSTYSHGPNSLHGSQTSPAPTYASVGRRKPVPLPETYYHAE